MGISVIPDEIRRYVVQCIPSVPYIEAALLMRESGAATWTPGLLGRRLYLNEEEAAQLLRKLQKDGIAVLQGDVEHGYRFAPATPELDHIWTELAGVYAKNLIEVSTLIHARPVGKARMLAEAFVWRKEK